MSETSQILVSYAITCHKRTPDLLSVMPSVVNAANQSPPVEIVIVDYGKQEPLERVLNKFRDGLSRENRLLVKVYRKRPYYHMGHARNLALKCANGEYIVVGASDIFLELDFFSAVRENFNRTNSTYLRSMTTGYIGILACRRDSLLDIGGWDERFEFYGPEDKDVLHRLDRNGAVIGYYDLDKLIRIIRTTNDQRTANYRVKMSKQEMSALGRQILEENDAKGVIVANEGISWGVG